MGTAEKITLYESAVAYAEAGVPVFPLKPKEKIPLFKGSLKNATTDLAQIKKWWEYEPSANIGIPMGKQSGIVGLDLDIADGLDPKFMDRLPPTMLKVKTPRGGFHGYFKYPDSGIKNGKKLELGATVRSDGYYFVAPPSIHPNGNPYLWETDAFYDGALDDCLQWIIDTKGIKESKKPPTEISEGSRHDYLKTKAAYFRHNGMDEDKCLDELIKINNDFPNGPKKLEELKSITAWTYQNVQPEENVENFSGWEGFKSDLVKEPLKIAIKEAIPGPNKEKKKKLSQSEIERLGHDILDCRFKLFIDNSATILFNITNINKKEVAVCTNEELLLRRLKQNVLEKTGNLQNGEFLGHVYKSWRLSAIPLKEQPKSFTWKDQDEWCFKKLDFIPSIGDFPAWKEFLDRLSSPEDFMAFIWSIFEYKNRSRQFLYLHDPAGEGGKSTIISVFGDIFGDSFEALNNTSTQGSRWLMGQLYGKRLAAWPDCKNPKFCMSETLRNITSGDWVTVEMKGQDLFSVQMYMKLIIGSNLEPEITSGGADTSRLINILVRENKEKKDDPDWKIRLKSELPFFLYECRKIYNEKCPHHGKILLSDISKEKVENSTESIEAYFEDLVLRRFEFSPDFKTSVTEWVSFYTQEKMDNQKVGNFKQYLLRHNPAIKIGRRKTADKKEMYYEGFKILDRSRSDQNQNSYMGI